MTKLMEELYHDYLSVLGEEVINEGRANELTEARQAILQSLNETQTKQLNYYLDLRSQKEEYMNCQCFIRGMNCIVKILTEALVGP